MTVRNRSGGIDSKTELDRGAAGVQTRGMTEVLHLVRRDPSRNLARFYRLELGRTLFGEVVLIRRWGRIGTEGQRREVVLPDHETGQADLTRWVRRKQGRGYAAV